MAKISKINIIQTRKETPEVAQALDTLNTFMTSETGGTVEIDTLNEIKKALETLQNAGEIDLSQYAKLEDIVKKTSELTNDSGFITINDVADYAKKSDIPVVPTVVSAFENDKGYLTEHQSLDGYAKTENIPTKVSQLENDNAYLVSSDLNGVATQDWVKQQGFVTDAGVDADTLNSAISTAIQNAGHLVDSDLDGKNISRFNNDAGFITSSAIPTDISSFTNDAGYLTEHQDLSAYAKSEDIPTVPTNVGAFTNDAGYLTEHQSLEGYAKTEDIPTDYVTNSAISDMATQEWVKEQGFITEAGVDQETLENTVNEAIKNAGHLVADDLKDYVKLEDLPEGADITYSNSNVTMSVGGIKAGDNIEKMTLQEVLNKILSPYVAIKSFTMSNNITTVQEKGTTATITSVRPSWTAGSKPITKFSVYKDSTYTTLLDENTTGAVITGLSVSGTSNFAVYGKLTDGDTTLTASTSVTFVDPFFYGVIADTTATISGLTKTVVSKGDKTYKFTCNGEHPIIAYPASYGALKSVLDSNGYEYLNNFTLTTKDVSVSSGTVSYNIYVYNDEFTGTDYSFTFKF